MQKPIRYYIQTRGEQPTMRTVPVTDRRQDEQPNVDTDLMRPTAAKPEHSTGRTAVGRLRLALKRGLR